MYIYNPRLHYLVHLRTGIYTYKLEAQYDTLSEAAAAVGATSEKRGNPRRGGARDDIGDLTRDIPMTARVATAGPSDLRAKLAAIQSARWDKREEATPTIYIYAREGTNARGRSLFEPSRDFARMYVCVYTCVRDTCECVGGCRSPAGKAKS